MRRDPYDRATDVLYKLTTIYYQGKSEARYPRFDVRREVTGYFHSLEDAERRIRKYVADEEEAKSSGKYRSDYDYYYGFVVDEIPFDWHLTGDAQHTRIYLEDGTFLHETKVSSLYNKDLATYDEGDIFDHASAKGFINLFALAGKTWAQTVSLD